MAVFNRKRWSCPLIAREGGLEGFPFVEVIALEEAGSGSAQKY